MINEKETLWIISELFPPEETSTGYIMGEIANAMTRKYDVKVICGPEVYDEKKKDVNNGGLSLDGGIKLIRVRAVKENKKSKLSRVRKFLLMSWRLYCVARKQINQGDRVLIVSNPFPLIVLMAHLRSKKFFTLSMLVHDIFPEGLYTDIHLPAFVYRVAEKVFNKSYSRVDTLISLGRDMNEVLVNKCTDQKHKPNTIIIENWGDVEGIIPEERKDDGYLKIQYAGNIGNAQGVGDMVELIHEANNPLVKFAIWGAGSAEDGIKNRVEELGMCDIVDFKGPYSRKQQTEVLNDSDLSLVTLVKGMYGLGVPSKTYNILAAGKPILYIGERGTEIWKTVEENEIGYCFEPDNKQGLVSFLHNLKYEDIPSLKEKGHKARKLVESKYSKEAILSKFLGAV